MTQSEAPGVDTLKQVLATLFSDGRSIGHIRAVTAKEWEQIIGSAEAKINRLIDDTRKTAYRRGYQAGHAAGKNNSVKGVSRKDFPEIQRKRELWLKKQR